MSNWPPLPCPVRCSSLAVAVWMLSVAQLPAQTEPPTANATLKTDTQQPIPRDDVPRELQRLIEDGKVEVVYDSDPEFVKASRGWADFHVQIRSSFKYDLTKSRKSGRWNVKIDITKLEPKIDLTHLIRLPSTFKSPDIWSSRVMRHEFDHVAVSLDPRAILLLRHLIEHLPAIERTLEPKEIPSTALLNKQVDAEVVKRRQAVVELMRQNNLRLDKVGAHGAQAIPNRAAFFAQLYTKENLAETKFPFIEQVLDLLETPEYQQAKLPFLARDPADR
ncbi:MAG: hypothetical protein IAG10_17580 [Planctomycetaceae bacterium]|nr:hypothetical protein [Planctomycetaceae bacterium]